MKSSELKFSANMFFKVKPKSVTFNSLFHFNCNYFLNVKMQKLLILSLSKCLFGQCCFN